MHPVFFGLKRAYYASLGLTRRTLRRMGLTAARMDMLYVIHKSFKSTIRQSQLWRTLGVCASVVSRMLKRLEAIGYVRCTVRYGHVRKRWISLTVRGRATILRAIRQFIGWGYAQLVLRSVLEPYRWHSAWHSYVALAQLREYLRLICVGFGDRADLGVYRDGVNEMDPPRETTLVLRWVTSA